MPAPDPSLRARHARVLAPLAVLATLASAPRPAAASAAPAPPALIAPLRWRPIGPFRGGWASAVAGVPDSVHTFYFGGAGGGVWKTDDAGTTWRALMQHERSAAIGALAVAPTQPRTLYVGTGQPDSRYDVASGDGIYRSDDGGETWRHRGLEATRHVGAILVDPHDPERVLVAALGSAFARNPERGVYLTIDGGRSWRGVLQPGDSVGAVDLAMDPAEPRVVYAATWQRRLHPWLDYFQPQVGEGSGLWRSEDRGEHWTRLVGGLPRGPLGRIGVAVAPGSRGRIVYAVVAATAAKPREPGGGLYRSNDRGEHWTLVNADPSLASSYFGRLTVAPGDSNTIYVMGQSIRRSRDGGAHFEVMRGSPGGDDYHALWINPRNASAMISGSDQGAAVSLNGGATWSSWYNQPTGQFYHLAADDRFPYHVYSGQQDNGTVEIATRGGYGAIQERDWHPVGGDERDAMVPKWGDPSIVFGSGLGGGVTRFDERTRQSAQVSPWPIGSYGERPTTVRYRYGWFTPLAVSAAPPHALFMGSQLLFRSLDDGDHWQAVSPDLTARREGAGPCDDPAPETARACGFGVISCIGPSPLAADRIWVGTDDGLVRLTTDGGAYWRDVTPPALPHWGLIASIDPSPLDTATAYVAVDLHRLDRRSPMLFRTHDSGRTWDAIGAGLPGEEFTSVVRADRARQGLLYAGTSRAVYVSIDDGDSWRELSDGLPTTWMRDLLPHGDDLVLATQGRGLWVLDDITPLREAREAAGEPLHLFAPAAAVRLRASEGHDTPDPPETPLGTNPRTGAVIDYALRAAPRGAVTLTITDASGGVVRRFSSAERPESLSARAYFEKDWLQPAAVMPATAGVHRFVWDLRGPRPPALSYHYSIAAIREAGTPAQPQGAFVLPGRYRVTLKADGVTRTRELLVALDPRLHVSEQALEAQRALARHGEELLARAVEGCRAARAARARRDSANAGPLADSLAAIAEAPGSGLAGLAENIASLLGELEAADAAPAQGMTEAFADCERRIDSALARWRTLQPRLSIAGMR
jgi:photosystem II stability/assembly factor-like uncharacterized protein